MMHQEDDNLCESVGHVRAQKSVEGASQPVIFCAVCGIDFRGNGIDLEEGW